MTPISITTYTRSCNAELYNRMIETLDVPGAKVRCTGMDKTQDAINYLHFILNDCTTDWLLNIDEDLVVLDNTQIPKIVECMDTNFIVCGLPDGGVPLRAHNPIVPNPFFNIFDMRVIRPLLKITPRVVIDAWVCREPKARTPWHLIDDKYVHDRYECFYGLFFWLLSIGHCYYFKSRFQESTQSTILIHDTEFLHHAWYSRKYGKDPHHTQRIRRVMCIGR